MHQAFETGLISDIKAVEGVEESRRYAGELDNPKEAKIADGDIPLVLVDFVEDDPIAGGVRAKWNLYIVHIAYSKSDAVRSATAYDLLDLRKNIRRSLKKKSIATSGPIKMKKMRKLFDARAAKGYLTCYVQTIEVDLLDSDPLPADANLE